MKEIGFTLSATEGLVAIWGYSFKQFVLVQLDNHAGYLQLYQTDDIYY